MSKVNTDKYVNVDYNEVIKLHDHNGDLTEYVLRHYKHRCQIINREEDLFMPYASAISAFTVKNWKYVKHNVYDSEGLGEGITYDSAFQADNDKQLKVQYVITSIETIKEDIIKKQVLELLCEMGEARVAYKALKLDYDKLQTKYNKLRS